MKHMIAPAALVAAGFFFALPSHAHGEVTATIGLPPIVVDANGVTIAIGQPAPPPVQEVVVVREAPPPPRQVIVVRDDPYYARPVIIRERERPRQVIVVRDDDRGCHKHKKHGRGHGYGHDHHDGHDNHAYFR